MRALVSGSEIVSGVLLRTAKKDKGWISPGTILMLVKGQMSHGSYINRKQFHQHVQQLGRRDFIHHPKNMQKI